MKRSVQWGYLQGLGTFAIGAYSFLVIVMGTVAAASWIKLPRVATGEEGTGMTEGLHVRHNVGKECPAVLVQLTYFYGLAWW